jgi:DNA-directed RNA polymerase specialized sigma24 family protein
MPNRQDGSQWRHAVAGDADAFEQAVAPYRDVLLRNARTTIQERLATGELNSADLSPEELVGETLLRAFQGRDRFHPERMELRVWLLALQRRALNRIASEETEYRDRKAISLDEEVPFREDYDAVEETFYEFGDPFDVTTYEELIPAQSPDDVEVDTRRPLTEEEIEFLERSGLDPRLRQVVQLHDEFELELDDVAQILEQSLHDTAENISAARVHIRQWLGSRDTEEYRDRSVDSYTGESLDRHEGS